MPPIFINTDNSDKKKKIYNAKLAGEAVDAAESKIKEMVIKAFANEADFTTNKIDNPKGYTLFCEFTEFSASGREISCKIVIEIMRYPASFTKKKGGSKPEKVMTAGELSGKATVSGKDALGQCIEAIMEKIVPKTFPVMIADMARR